MRVTYLCVYFAGEVRPVDGTVFDLRNPVTLTEDLLSKTGVGFDHNFCLQRNNKRNLHAKYEIRATCTNYCGS